MYCMKCGAEIPDNSVFCSACGFEQNKPAKETKFCKHCGTQIDKECVVCVKCGKQVEELQSAQPNVVINNTNTNTNTNVNRTYTPAFLGRSKNKWVALALCIFLGAVGAHKFYEGKFGMGILYLCTVGLFGIGWIIDIISLLLKPNPYYV